MPPEIPKVRAEVKALIRCCDVLFNGTPFIPLNTDEQSVMIAYINRLKHKFDLPI